MAEAQAEKAFMAELEQQLAAQPPAADGFAVPRPDAPTARRFLRARKQNVGEASATLRDTRAAWLAGGGHGGGGAVAWWRRVSRAGWAGGERAAGLRAGVGRATWRAGNGSSDGWQEQGRRRRWRL